jgi:3-keto-disaccharide hydrolase
MKTNIAALIAALCLVVANLVAAAEKDEVILFNGKNFDGWTAVIGRPGFKLEDIWSVADGGILVCKGKGKASGYLRSSRDDFHDYTLTLQWRFPAGTPGGNSGVLVHASTPNALGVWPKSLEAQLNHTHAGDIWVIGTTCEIENAEKRVMGRRHYNLTDGSERPIGEWNDYKIVCDGDQITIWVNGDLVNHITKCSVNRGAVCLQAEGADIEFRDIRLKPLAK